MREKEAQIEAVLHSLKEGLISLYEARVRITSVINDLLTKQ